MSGNKLEKDISRHRPTDIDAHILASFDIVGNREHGRMELRMASNRHCADKRKGTFPLRKECMGRSIASCISNDHIPHRMEPGKVGRALDRGMVYCRRGHKLTGYAHISVYSYRD
ncbi:hypothetical protein MW887_006263 [Aspergillus wentii]|nr:hypothetical protein MW887_006263 [Aspergillus wentii]